MSSQRDPVGTVHVRVPAKINLFLAVRGRRPDGMHEIASVMHTVGLFDRLSADLVGPRGACYHPTARRRMSVTLVHDAGDRVPLGDDNLAVRAAHAIATSLGGRPTSDDADLVTRLSLEKRIPVGAGMAGGSADAAAALVALNRLWGGDLSTDELRWLGESVGADVPFCVTGGTALATGTGAATAQVLCRGRFHWVVGLDDHPLSTAEVYEAWDRWCRPGEIEPDAVLHALRTQDSEALGAALHNDLQPAAFGLRPALRERWQAMLDAGALGAVVSGSGPTLVALAGDEAHARELAGRVGDVFAGVEVVRSPAGGPEIVPHL